MRWVERQAKRGNRVDAMRGYQQLTGTSMREAKTAIAAMAGDGPQGAEPTADADEGASAR